MIPGENKGETMRLPFENSDSNQINEIRREFHRKKEAVHSHTCAVLHGFSCTIPEVRKAGTIGRMDEIQRA
jgi:hypothetical protein